MPGQNEKSTPGGVNVVEKVGLRLVLDMILVQIFQILSAHPVLPTTHSRICIPHDKSNTDATDDVMFNGMVTVSEIMWDAGPYWNMVQWIELYNSSIRLST